MIASAIVIKIFQKSFEMEPSESELPLQIFRLRHSTDPGDDDGDDDGDDGDGAGDDGAKDFFEI